MLKDSLLSLAEGTTSAPDPKPCPPPTHTCYSHVARLGTPSSWIEVLSSAESTGGNYFDFLEYAAVGARGFYLQYPGSPPEHIHATQVGSGVGVSHDARGGG